MKKSLNFLAVLKQNGLIAVMFALIAIFTACEKMPELTPDNNWSENGYTLKMGTSSNSLKAPAPGAPATGIVNIPQLFLVSGPDGQGVDGVNFVFSDGTSVIGRMIAHTFTSVGSFTVTATLPDATVLSGTINITTVTVSPNGDIYLVSSSLAAGKWTYTIGLPTSYIYGYSLTGGWCWVEGTTAGWPLSPLNAYALSTTVMNGGIRYLSYTFTKNANDWEQLIWGENMTSGVSNWASDTSSIYFRPAATGGGTYYIYCQNGQIYPSVPALVLPGDVGDVTSNWITRVGIVNDTVADKYNVTLYINNSAIANPGTPQLLYKLDADPSFTTATFTAGTDYWASPVITVDYTSLIAWKGDAASTINYTASSLYSPTLLAFALQMQAGW